MKNAITTFILIFLIHSFSFAQSQMEINQKANAAYKKADAKMSLLFKKVQKDITDSAQKKLLLDAQRAWIKFKEAHCKSAAAVYEGGSIQPYIYSDCLTRLTNERIKQLNIYLEKN